MTSPYEFDVAIVGAGAAGLCAAAELARQGCTVAVLEARERIGGRIFTQTGPHLPMPVELGAEFIHGAAPVTRELLRSAGLLAVDTAGQRLSRQQGQLRPRQSLFDQVRSLLEQARGLSQDLSVEQFLTRHASGAALEPLRTYVRMMVEGFDAADPELASAQAIAAEWSGSSLEGQYRPLGGYGLLLAALARSLDPAHSCLMLGCPVEHVEWGGRHVQLQVRAPGGVQQIRARRALITLPVSLLQSQPDSAPAVRFEPELTDKRAALAGLALGPVIKVVLQFRSAFWEQLQHGAFAEAGFLHAPQAPFPTVWTALPVRAPLLTTWMGGPRAARLAGVTRAQLIQLALESVQQVFAIGSALIDELTTAHVHDWGADPCARGAYCYVTVGGAGAAGQLAEPLDDTLYFAGEAAHPGQCGTVEAALQSGRRAAAALLSAHQRER
jgi:monoamine oxidase